MTAAFMAAAAEIGSGNGEYSEGDGLTYHDSDINDPSGYFDSGEGKRGRIYFHLDGMEIAAQILQQDSRGLPNLGFVRRGPSLLLARRSGCRPVTMKAASLHPTSDAPA